MNKYNRFLFPIESIIVGLDIHKKHWSVTIVKEGQVIKRCSIPGNWPSLLGLLKAFDPAEVLVSYEAGYFGYWLHDKIQSWGGRCLVVAPSLIPTALGNRVKTDRKDSLKLAHLTAQGLLKPVYVPSEENRANRQLIRQRNQLMGDRRRVQNRIKARLSYLGIEYPEETCWGPLFIKQLKAISFPYEVEKHCFEIYIKEYEWITELIHDLTEKIKQLAQTTEYKMAVQILTSAPGIGLLSAMEFLLEIEDISRFSNGQQLAAYVGLTPSQYSSGDKTRMGRITKAGKSHLRATLIESSWTAIKKDPTLQQKYECIKLRSGSKRAIVAVARNLLIRLRFLLLAQQKYSRSQAA